MKAGFENIKLDIFGESHSARIGMTIDGIPVGTRLDLHCVRDLLKRRGASLSPWSTSRTEQDEPAFEGLEKICEKFEVKSAQIKVYLANSDIKSADYDKIRHIPRPSHADLAAYEKDGVIPLGGGRFSGRMTALLCVAGGIAKELLEARGISVDAYLTSVAGVKFPCAYDIGDVATCGLREGRRRELKARELPVLDSKREEEAKEILARIAADGDSAGGEVECLISGLGVGEAGDALFDGIEGKLAYAVFAVPAVKGVEFGRGFELADMRGSEANDPIGLRDGRVAPLSNNGGGINGGISNGLPIILRAAIKPTPSIAKAQRSVDLEKMEECELRIEGRHDVCIAPRAVAAIEAVCALAVYDMILSK